MLDNIIIAIRSLLVYSACSIFLGLIFTFLMKELDFFDDKFVNTMTVISTITFSFIFVKWVNKLYEDEEEDK